MSLQTESRVVVTGVERKTLKSMNFRREKKESIKKSQKGWSPNPRNSADLTELPGVTVVSDTHVWLQRFGLPPLVRDDTVRAAARELQRTR